MARQTRVLPEFDHGGDPGHQIMAETDESVLEAARRSFPDAELVSDADPRPGDWAPVAAGDPGPVSTTQWRPDAGDMVTVRGGGLYLPARKRISWMRQEVPPHPEWTIDTSVEEIRSGTFKGGKVEGGYARVRASVYDSTGRLISTGIKTEYSERFTDFAEKAETGAIGRALAVAGYGTEAALDLDEGIEDDRIADAPVPVPGRSINITPSSLPGLKQGGRSEEITTPQLREIARLSKERGFGTSGTGLAMNEIKGEDLWKADMANVQDADILAELQTWSFEEASNLITRLSRAT